MGEILAGKASDAQIAALLVALHMKGETVEEIVGFAEAIRAAAQPIANADGTALDVSGTEREALVDTCGTGGDASDTFNISTVTALTIAGAGVRVAKHGNRGITSKCGSADVMEALGVNITMPPARIADCLREVGIAFMFAPAMHTATKYVQPARRELRPLRQRLQSSGTAHQSRARIRAGGRSVFSRPGRQAGEGAADAGTESRTGGAWQ